MMKGIETELNTYGKLSYTKTALQSRGSVSQRMVSCQPLISV